MNRRRFLSIIASGAALPLLSGQAPAAAPPLVWQGAAMGAKASMTLLHEDRAHGLRLIERCLAEIDRLENIFSLFRPASALSRLNAQGFLEEPPVELVEVSAFSLGVAQASGGAFDPTVQPLYQVYAEHFSGQGASTAGPSPGRIAAARSLVGYRQVKVDGGRIAFDRPGMAVTLNAVAQGYVTDRVAALLKAEGIENVLLDLGEIVGVGHDPSGRAWKAAVFGGPAGRNLLDVELRDSRDVLSALATSAGYGTPFERSGRFHHLIDPRDGASAHHHASVTVAAPNAMLADALSTALYLMPPGEAAGLLSKYAPAAAFFFDSTGRLTNTVARA